MLLTPDLQGEVRDPGWYFRNAGVPVGREAMDLLVRVRGWRRYEIEPAMQGEYDEPDVLPEVSARVSGRVLDRKGAGGVQNCVVTLAAPGTGILEQAVSREDGRFVFTGFEIPEGTRFVVSAKTATGRENVYLVLDEVPSWFEGVPAPRWRLQGNRTGGITSSPVNGKATGIGRWRSWRGKKRCGISFWKR